MLKISTHHLVHKFLCSFSILMLAMGMSTNVGQAQPQYSTALGSSSNVFPLGNTATNRVQWLYAPSEFTPTFPASPQMITKLYIKVGSSPTSTTAITFTNFNVWLGTTPTTSLSTTWQTGLTNVISATSYTTVPAVVYNGWFEIPLPTPYMYNPAAGNLVLELSQQGYTPLPMYMLQLHSGSNNRRSWGSIGSPSANGSDNGHVQLGLDMGPACDDVTLASMNVSNVSTDEATVNWGIPQMSASFEYHLSQTATPPTPTTQTISTTNNSVTLTNLTPNTYYYFHVRNVCTAGTSLNWTTLGFSTLPCTLAQPATTVNGTTTFCEGAITDLSVPLVLGATYTWYKNGVQEPGAVNASYTAFMTGAYHAVMSMKGCSVSSDTTSVLVHPAPTYSYTASDLDICDGASSTLAVNTTNSYVYQWQRNNNDIPGATGQTYMASQAGDYRVLVTTPNCTDTSLTRTIVSFPVPNATINTTNLPVLSTTQGFQTYQWYLGGVPIPNTNTHTITATQNGTYSVSFVDQNGCKNTTPSVIVGPQSIAGITGASAAIRVYPNPTSGTLQLTMPKNYTASLQTIDGKILRSHIEQGVLQMDELSDGVYFLRFYDEGNRLVHLEKVIKQ